MRDLAIREVPLHVVRPLRREVFIVEQGVREEEEWDDLDARATHFAAFDSGVLVACARAVESEGVAKIGRVAVPRAHRGKGHGRAIMQHVLAWCRTHGCGEVTLDAQLHVAPFYEALGFLPEGEVFLDARIEHIRMRRGTGS